MNSICPMNFFRTTDTTDTTIWKPGFRKLKEPRQRRQQEPHKFASLTMKNNSIARFARAFLDTSLRFSFFPRREMTCFAVVWTTCMDIWRHTFNFVFSPPKRWFKFNSRIVTTQFASVMTLNNWEMITETRSYIFRWRSRFRRRRVCLCSQL